MSSAEKWLITCNFVNRLSSHLFPLKGIQTKKIKMSKSQKVHCILVIQVTVRIVGKIKIIQELDYQKLRAVNRSIETPLMLVDPFPVQYLRQSIPEEIREEEDSIEILNQPKTSKLRKLKINLLESISMFKPDHLLVLKSLTGGLEELVKENELSSIKNEDSIDDKPILLLIQLLQQNEEIRIEESKEVLSDISNQSHLTEQVSFQKNIEQFTTNECQNCLTRNQENQRLMRQKKQVSMKLDSILNEVNSVKEASIALQEQLSSEQNEYFKLRLECSQKADLILEQANELRACQDQIDQQSQQIHSINENHMNERLRFEEQVQELEEFYRMSQINLKQVQEELCQKHEENLSQMIIHAQIQQEQENTRRVERKLEKANEKIKSLNRSLTARDQEISDLKATHLLQITNQRQLLTLDENFKSKMDCKNKVIQILAFGIFFFILILRLLVFLQHEHDFSLMNYVDYWLV